MEVLSEKADTRAALSLAAMQTLNPTFYRIYPRIVGCGADAAIVAALNLNPDERP